VPTCTLDLKVDRTQIACDPAPFTESYCLLMDSAPQPGDIKEEFTAPTIAVAGETGDTQSVLMTFSSKGILTTRTGGEVPLAAEFQAPRMSISPFTANWPARLPRYEVRNLSPSPDVIILELEELLFRGL